MSRIGKLPVNIPDGVSVTVAGQTTTVTGPKGTLTLLSPAKIKVEVANNLVLVSRLSEDKQSRSSHGSTRAHIANMIKGVTETWTKELEIRGTGYKFVGGGTSLTVSAGYIHPVKVSAPDGITFQVPDESKLIITGADKVVVGQTASNIRKIRTPEPYKGKGIRYVNEFIKLKAGKTAKA